MSYYICRYHFAPDAFFLCRLDSMATIKETARRSALLVAEKEEFISPDHQKIRFWKLDGFSDQFWAPKMLPKEFPDLGFNPWTAEAKRNADYEFTLRSLLTPLEILETSEVLSNGKIRRKGQKAVDDNSTTSSTTSTGKSTQHDARRIADRKRRLDEAAAATKKAKKSYKDLPTCGEAGPSFD